MMPGFVASTETKQIDWSFNESKMNHLPRRNRVLSNEQRVPMEVESTFDVLPEDFDEDFRGI